MRRFFRRAAWFAAAACGFVAALRVSPFLEAVNSMSTFSSVAGEEGTGITVAAVFVFVLVTGAGALVGFLVVRTVGWWVQMRLSQMSDAAGEEGHYAGEREPEPYPDGNSDPSGQRNGDVTPAGEVLGGAPSGVLSGGPMAESTIVSAVAKPALAASVTVKATQQISDEPPGGAPEVADGAMAQTAFESSAAPAPTSTDPAPLANGGENEATLPVTSVEEGARDAVAIQPTRLRRRRRLAVKDPNASALV
ncbi:MAG: hypothetical protein ACI9W2_003300 [Gammaproteobacteria bacterium]|jgi:hypothetical protein